MDTVLSPDGSAVAVLWDFAYFAGADVVSDLYHNYVVAFYASDGAFRYAKRVSAAPPGESDAAQFGPLPIAITLPALRSYPDAVSSVATVFNRLVWASDGEGVYLIDSVEDAAVFLAYDQQADASSAPAPLPAPEVPAYSLPTRSGPVRESGLAAVIEADGNTSELRFEQLAGWNPFGSYGTVPLADATY